MKKGCKNIAKCAILKGGVLFFSAIGLAKNFKFFIRCYGKTQWTFWLTQYTCGFSGGANGKESAYQCRRQRDMGSISESGRSREKGMATHASGGFPGGSAVNNPPAHLTPRVGRGHKWLGFKPWVRKIPWRRAGQPTPVFLPGESHGHRSLAGYSPQSCRIRYDWSDYIHNTYLAGEASAQGKVKAPSSYK